MVSDDQQLQAQRILVRRMLAFAHMDATNLARKAGVAPSTLTRFLNDPNVKRGLTGPTLEKLSKVVGFPFPIEDPLLPGDVVEPAAETPPLSQPALNYVVEHLDQVRLLTLWEMLDASEKQAVLRYLKQLIRPQRADSP